MPRRTKRSYRRSHIYIYIYMPKQSYRSYRRSHTYIYHIYICQRRTKPSKEANTAIGVMEEEDRAIGAMYATKGSYACK